MITTRISDFPYGGFPFRIDYKDENKNAKVCYFECKEHMEKYILQNNLKKKNISIKVNKDN
jgi:hypothetical protein